jgi:hypothetical protein
MLYIIYSLKFTNSESILTLLKDYNLPVIYTIDCLNLLCYNTDYPEKLKLTEVEAINFYNYLHKNYKLKIISILRDPIDYSISELMNHLDINYIKEGLPKVHNAYILQCLNNSRDTIPESYNYLNYVLDYSKVLLDLDNIKDLYLKITNLTETYIKFINNLNKFYGINFAVSSGYRMIDINKEHLILRYENLDTKELLEYIQLPETAQLIVNSTNPNYIIDPKILISIPETLKLLAKTVLLDSKKRFYFRRLNYIYPQ